MFGRSRKKTDVLVVGAGPAGLLTALQLDREGIDVEVIDQAWRATGRSYAAALHPTTLALLDELGLAKRVVAAAHRIDRFALYDGEARRAEVDLAALPGQFPWVAVLPQSVLESVLEEELQARGRPVHWLHRLASFEQDEDRVVAEVDVLESVPGGYAVAVQGTEVARTLMIESQLLIGADGYRSLVRRQLGIEYESWGEVETFDVYEFESDDDAAGEVRVVLDERSTNVLWTLPGGRQRWSFQVLGADTSERERVKSRLMMSVPGEAKPRFTAELLRELIAERAPWFRQKQLGDIAWAGDVSFERRLAKELGRDRVWLVGDAVHQTGPVGVQSMNVGLLEARRLASVVRDAIHGKVGPEGFGRYVDGCIPGWCRLLGIQELFVTEARTEDWLASRLDRLVPCLPASGEDLALIGRQLDLRIAGER